MIEGFSLGGCGAYIIPLDAYGRGVFTTPVCAVIYGGGGPNRSVAFSGSSSLVRCPVLEGYECVVDENSRLLGFRAENIQKALGDVKREHPDLVIPALEGGTQSENSEFR